MWLRVWYPLNQRISANLTAFGNFSLLATLYEIELIAADERIAILMYYSRLNPTDLFNPLILMNINQVREHLHRLIDEVDDIYVLNGLYRNLLSDKLRREEYEREQTRTDAREKAKRQSNKSTRRSE